MKCRPKPASNICWLSAMREEREKAQMKIDYSIKYIFFDLEGKKYLISFRDTFSKGVYDVSVSTRTGGIGYGRTNAIIKECYPGFIERLKSRIEFWKVRNYGKRKHRIPDPEIDLEKRVAALEIELQRLQSEREAIPRKLQGILLAQREEHAHER